MSQQLTTVLTTTLTLINQFQETLSPPSLAQSTQPPSKDGKALPLLTASSSALKAQVTKLSLLAISTPFTHSAIVNVLRACNDSVLPSLLTATLLVNPAEYTTAFHTEVLVLSKGILTEFATLVKCVKAISENKDQTKKQNPGKKEAELPKTEKDSITSATGRVWDACDALTHIATNGVVGFITHRVEQWRDLVQDAVDELENWDPEEDDDDFFDDILGDDAGEKSDGAESDKDSDKDTEALAEHKKSSLRFLKPILQVYPAIIKNRFKTIQDEAFTASGDVARLEKLLLHLKSIPDQVDEAAGALYEDDIDLSVKFLLKTQKKASQAVESAKLPLDSNDAKSDGTTGDKFSVWSSTWSKVMDEVAKSIRPGSTESEQ
ncbi:hypothetical protein N7478_006009 [Penicillium angulare]|uniref:uncharacterized protein n=1 Tax=Penicillium angulare TaxID=116970 RepID=UPI00253F7415|nr:uncharacterized protein N7478_006009 [Penicillium angulare]KAJ5280637.1 hypothetical protein N7478_006009 [Penicillium angulare]